MRPLYIRRGFLHTAFLGTSLCTALCLLSCGEPLTQIVLRVDSDIPTTDVGRILVNVRGPSGVLAVDYSTDFGGPGSPDGFPITLGLLLADDAVGEMVSVEVVANEVAGSERVEVSAETNFVIGSSRELVLRLDSVCLEIPCGTGETCSEGVCITNQIDGESLPEFAE
ncbi:MAG: hypothetical protein ACI9KE_001690 [Polyangiales bacterium]|jgi:hypothetical protein